MNVITENNNVRCSVCNNDMGMYYRDFNIMLNYCNQCCHFNGIVYSNDHDTCLFKDPSEYKIVLSSYIFYSQYYNYNSYFIININDMKKILRYINKNGDTVIYFICESYDNIQHASKGVYDFYSTNSVRYYCSLLRMYLTNVFILKDVNKTIYEISVKNNYEKPIIDILYTEMSDDIYLTRDNN